MSKWKSVRKHVQLLVHNYCNWQQKQQNFIISARFKSKVFKMSIDGLDTLHTMRWWSQKQISAATMVWFNLVVVLLRLRI